MKNTFIKSVVENNIKDSENNTKKQVEITFNDSQKSVITLTGEGSIKVLMPV
ncbi:MAG: hypothetical protein MZV64_27130 [Ignavibacteriales bacterium]|nr:hypothetical protein [Ignavibacteriales bacterium]